MEEVQNIIPIVWISKYMARITGNSIALEVGIIELSWNKIPCLYLPLNNPKLRLGLIWNLRNVNERIVLNNRLKKIAKNDAFRLNFNQLAIPNESFFNQSNTVNAFEFNAK